MGLVISRNLSWLYALVVVTGLAEGNGGAQAVVPSQALNLAIIVVPTRADAEGVLKQLNAGVDFGVLAKEKSTDASAVDGGYMGALEPNALRSELRDALGGHRVGQLTDIVQVPSGFAILKVLPAPPVSGDLNPKRILALISRGEIRFGAPLSGQVEANAIMQEFPKPEGWNRDLQAKSASCAPSRWRTRKAVLRTALERGEHATGGPRRCVRPNQRTRRAGAIAGIQRRDEPVHRGMENRLQDG